MRLASVSLLVLCGCSIVTVAAAEAPAWSGSASAASDYVYRGVSQSQAGPVVQLDLEYGAGEGLFAGAFGSNVDYTAPGDADDGIDMEYAVRVGWRQALTEGTSMEVKAERMLYPGANDPAGSDYHSFGLGIAVGERLGVQVEHAPDYYNLGGAATDYSASVAWSMASLDFTLRGGYFDQQTLAGGGYRHLELGVSRSFGRLWVDAAVSGTSGYTEAIAEVNGDPRLAGSRARVGVGVEF